MKLNSRLRLFLLGSTLLANVSVQAETVIYEPFTNSDTTLNGNAAGTGLTGNWTASATLGVTVGSSLAWGSVPTSGNRVAYTGAAANTTASVGLSSALGNSGLLNDGSSVWFSMMFNTPAVNGGNEDLSFILGTDTLGGVNAIPIANSGSGLGFTFNAGGLKATSYNGGTRTQATGVALTTNTTYLITGQLIFGTNGAADTVKLYLPTTGLVLGDVRSATSAALSQAAFDTLAFGMKSNTAVGFDEIRFGGTYLDSIGMSATSAYWDLNSTGTGAGSATPSGTWDTSLNWNATADGTGATAAWTPGQTAVFSAGSDATGSYAVNVVGTQSFGGLLFKDGTVTISGGTALDLVSAGGAIEVRDATKTATISTAITQSSGSGALYKEGGGTLVLSGDNTYAGPTIMSAGTLILSGNNVAATGGMQLNGGVTRFDSLNSINGTARDVSVNSGAVAMFGIALSNTEIADVLLNRIVATSAGVIAADNNGGGDFNLNTAGLTAAYFGAVGTVNYTGTLTPNGNYRLGGGGGTLTMANTNALTGAKTLTVSDPGTVVLQQSNSYTGATTVNNGGTLSVTTLANASSDSSIGAFATAGATGLILNGGTFQYTGNSVTTNRGITLSASSTIVVSADSAALTLGASSMAGVTLNVTGGSGSSLSLGATALSGNPTLNPTTASLIVDSFTGTNRSLTLTGSSTGNSITGASATGNGTLTKNGSSTWTLGGASVYTGATTVNSGTLILNGSLNSLTPLTMGGGTFEVNPSAASQTMASLAYSGNGSNIVVGASKTLAITSGTFTRGNWTSMNFDLSASGSAITIPFATIDTPLSTTGASITVLDATGFGAAAVNGSNQIYRVTDTAIVPLLVASGSSSTTHYQVDNHVGSDVGSNGLTITATQTVASLNVDTTANSGILTLGSGVTLRTNEWNFGGVGANTYKITGGTGLNGAAGNNNLSFNNYGGTVTIESPILVNGSAFYAFSGTGTTVLAGANTIGSSQTGVNSSIRMFGSGTLQIAGTGSLNAGNSSIYNSDIQINDSTTFQYSSSTNQTFSGTISGTGALIKDTSSSTLTLSGANTYTGTTTVSTGTLLVNNTTGSGTGTNTVTVASGATLGGTGTMSGAVNVTGVLSPGASIESLVTGDLTMASGSTFVYEVADNTSTGADMLGVNGTLSLDNVTLTFDLATLAALSNTSWAVGEKLTLISYTGTAINSGFAGYADDTNYSFDSNVWTFNYDDTVAGNNFDLDHAGTSHVTLTALTIVPEPSSAALLGTLGAMLLFRRRRYD